MSRSLSADLDLMPSTRGELPVVEGLEAVRQRVFQRLRFFRNEWFLAANQGVPYLQQIFVQPTPAGLAAQIIVAEILAVRGVTDVTDVDARLDPATRKLALRARVHTPEGVTVVETEV